MAQGFQREDSMLKTKNNLAVQTTGQNVENWGLLWELNHLGIRITSDELKIFKDLIWQIFNNKS
jgi:hypothetical protein